MDIRLMGWAVAASLCAGTLQAAGPAPEAGPGGGSNACASDIEKFCKGVQPGEHRIEDCLKPHEAELSEACKKQGEQAKAAREKMAQKPAPKTAQKEAAPEGDWNACKAEVERFCKGVKPGEHRIEDCLKPHEAEFSEACKKQGERAKAAREKMDRPPQAVDGVSSKGPAKKK